MPIDHATSCKILSTRVIRDVSSSSEEKNNKKSSYFSSPSPSLPPPSFVIVEISRRNIHQLTVVEESESTKTKTVHVVDEYELPGNYCLYERVEISRILLLPRKIKRLVRRMLWTLDMCSCTTPEEKRTWACRIFDHVAKVAAKLDLQTQRHGHKEVKISVVMEHVTRLLCLEAEAEAAAYAAAFAANAAEEEKESIDDAAAAAEEEKDSGDEDAAAAEEEEESIDDAAAAAEEEESIDDDDHDAIIED